MNLVQRLDSTQSRQEKAQQPCFPPDSPPSTLTRAGLICSNTLETSPSLKPPSPVRFFPSAHIKPLEGFTLYQEGVAIVTEREGCPTPEPQRGEVVLFPHALQQTKDAKFHESATTMRK